ncbi:MAG TPA: flagellar motor stator protein MotA [Alphaproteobacteria bacterium]|nr:flagellar motor stator protein MotA [Alphaproteobacteria bacterium]
MLVIAGAVIVLVSVLGGYVALGGHIAVLIQPFEVVIICGAAAGAFIITNPKDVLRKSLSAVMSTLKGSKYDKQAYLELLGLQYTLFKLGRSKGPLALEQHLENPDESTVFQAFPRIAADHHAMTFITDYLRLLTLGTDNPHELESLIDEEIETHHHEQSKISGAIQEVADALPALGIVAAVLGVIKTMGSITEPPEVLGKLIAGALVGTFLGVLLAYGFVGPLAGALKAMYDSETKYYMCIKAGLVAYLQGYAPAVCVEFARKALYSSVRPTFYEVEEATEAAPKVT